MSILQNIIDRARSTSKTLYELHPDLEYRVPILRILSGEEQGMSTAGSFIGNTQFYQTQVWVHKAIKVLKDNISPLVVNVVRGEKNEIEILDKHPITSLLANPNPEMGASSLWSEWLVDMMLGGEEGFEVVKSADGSQVLELWPRQPQVFSVIPEKGGRRYRRVAAYKVEDNEADPYELKPDEFIHFKFYNPANPWRGLAPITAVRMGILIDQLAQAWTRLFFRNQARPDYALIAPEGLTKTERDEYLNELSPYGTGEGLHRPIILERGVTDIKAFSWPPKDLEWLEQRKLARDEVGAIFGVPDEIMGYGRDTYENFDTADRVLWTLTIVPLVGHRDNTLTRWLRKVKVIQADERIMTDMSGVPQLQDDISDKVSQFVNLVQNRIPPNQANERLGLGFTDIPDGDTVYVPFSMVPVGTDRQEAPQRTITSAIQKATIPEYGSAEHEVMWKRTQARIDKPVEAMQRMLKRYFQDQQNAISQGLRNSREYGRGKFTDASKFNIPSPIDLFDFDYWIQQFIERFLGSLVDWLNTIGQDELDGLMTDADFDVESPSVSQGIRHILETVAKKTNDTTWEGLIELFQEAEAAGEGIPAIQERLSAFYGDRKSDWQTERIARTTMTGAANFGTMEAWKQSEVVQSKAWLSALLPGRTRDEHEAAHGQTVPLNAMFDVGGEMLAYPGDPNGSPGNVINCLCSLVAEIIED